MRSQIKLQVEKLALYYIVLYQRIKKRMSWCLQLVLLPPIHIDQGHNRKEIINGNAKVSVNLQ